MQNRWIKALVTSLLSIVPMIVIVLILSFSKLAPLDAGRGDYALLLIGMVVLIVGLSVFQIGASSSLTKVGEYMGTSLSKQKSLFIVCLFAFALGTLITVAEPSILIVSKQVNINPVLLIGGIAVGVGRGSAGGCLLSFLLGITQIDPMPFDLLFERFLLPERGGLQPSKVTVIGEDIVTKNYVTVKFDDGRGINFADDAEFLVNRNGDTITVLGRDLEPGDDIIIDRKDELFTIEEL